MFVSRAFFGGFFDGGFAPILVDGGFRRGTDVYKALALGATAVGIGRPYIWGLASFGQEGVEAVLTILRRELEVIMRQSGTTSVSRITAAHLAPAPGWPQPRGASGCTWTSSPSTRPSISTVAASPAPKPAS